MLPEWSLHMRDVYDLSGVWSFRLDEEKVGIENRFYEADFDDTMILPGTTSLAKKGRYNEKRETEHLTDEYAVEGYAWFKRKVGVKALAGKVVKLKLERTRLTKVWVDDKAVGECDCLVAPHVYELTEFIPEDKEEIELTIMVSNTDYPTGGGHLTSPDTQSNWLGIVGEIALQTYEKVYIDRVVTYPDVSKKMVGVDIYVVNTTTNDEYMQASVTAQLMDEFGYIGNTLGKRIKNFELKAGIETIIHLDYNLGLAPELWSEHNPRIYELKAALENGEEIATHFGLRNFSTTSKRFLINGNPTFLRGKHDGLTFPLTGVFPTDLISWIHVLKISKSYGINHYRYHTCCPPEAAFLAADLVGIYMEPQLPFWGTLSGPEDEGHNATEHEYLVNQGFLMLDWYGNHASFCMMSLGNELWGNKDVMNDILSDYKIYDSRHLYTQGSNNFQHAPLIVPQDDFYVGVRLAPFDRHFRGSYGMCDTPLGHIQSEEPSTTYNYDKIIHPDIENIDVSGVDPDAEIEIQYGTGVKKVKASELDDEILVPKIPVISHEIGQFAVYPNFREISKYKGPLKARNFEVFRERLESKGMLDLAEDFFMASGKFAVDCYKEELEAAARSDLIAGYQILDIQDFQGQGTALVGILDAFMDSKGLVNAEEWRGYCSDAVLMANFTSYILRGGDEFHADTAIRYYNPARLSNAKVNWSLKIVDVGAVRKAGKLHPEGQHILSDAYSRGPVLTCIAEGEISVPDGVSDLVKLSPINVTLPDTERPYALRLTLHINNTDIQNSYDLWLYPNRDSSEARISSILDVKQRPSRAWDGLPFGALTLGEAEPGEVVRYPELSEVKESFAVNSHNLKYSALITNDMAEASAALKNGQSVLLLPYEVSEAIRGFYCTDFWCYPMFRNICEWMKKPTAVGTMGLLINNTHPVFNSFPTLKYSTPQWYKIVSHSDCVILDDVTDISYRPIVQMIDNFDRNHKLGILFEGRVYSGRLMVCTSRLSEIRSSVEVIQFTKSLLTYILSEEFDPVFRLDLEKLKEVLV